MINRRHIRIKVMQSAYALMLSENDKLDKQERFLLESIERLHELYLLQLQLLFSLFEIANTYNKAAKVKYLQNDSALVNSPNFANNRLLNQIKKGILLQKYELEKDKPNWQDHKELVERIWKNIQKKESFSTYMQLTNPTYADDKKIVVNLFKKVIAPNEQLADFFEDEVISWVDDIPFVNTWIVENLTKLGVSKSFTPDKLYKDTKDKEFALELFRKTILNFSKYEKDIDAKTPNWDSDRITKIDKLLIVMGIAEFLHFPSIPTKVTINEYIEIAKDYATPKSSFFINGVLDKILDDYVSQKKVNKTGRGLL